MSSDFSDLVREIRHQLNLSREELTQELDISFATIDRWRNNKIIPSRLVKN